MKSLFEALEKDKGIAKLKKIFSQKQETLVCGLSGSQKRAVFAACFDTFAAPCIIVCRNDDEANMWREDLANLLPAARVAELTETDVFDVAAEAKGAELAARRTETLGALFAGEKMIVVATARAAAIKDMTRDEFAKRGLYIETGLSLPKEKLLAMLAELGYRRTDETENMGEFSARGGIVDIFPINAAAPFRVEFFGDEIDSIRRFDIFSKRSTQNVGSLTALPLQRSRESDAAESFVAYMKNGVIVFDEPMRICDEINAMTQETPEIGKNIFTWEETVAFARKKNVVYFSLMPYKILCAEPKETIGVTMSEMMPFRRQMDIFADEVARWQKEKKSILVLVGNRQRGDSLREFFAKRRMSSLVTNRDDALSERFINIKKGALSNGFELPSARLVVVTEKEIFGTQKRRAAFAKSSEEQIKHYGDISLGDYVVHTAHGIGRYIGVETLEVDGVRRDYLHIKYGGDDKLFVPTDQVRLLQKYVGKEEGAPKLHRLSSAEWKNTKAKAMKSAEDIAARLLEIYARRKRAAGFAFSKDDAAQREFEEAFPYEETEGQLKAIAEIKADMESDKPMDRLLCGDVGFGKTEVAIRAAYKAALNGKQVAVLAPTTVLAEQHYQTFSARFADFEPVVGVVCRFRTAKEQKETLQRVREGKVDILIGTHAILNQKKVAFKDLGLLIIDEEQRFGVKQKEKIRALFAGVDVLALSATPIPRTLHLSLVGARDMSLIETPPAERLPVQTYVIENNDAIVTDAIKRELKRGGQVYFVCSRIELFDYLKPRLEALVPEAKIRTAHGQMSEELLERAIMDFFEGEYDVLLATSIVENGLDVPRANTMIVYDADRFGLSQLYQMRGRVGRSHRMAFAYFVYRAGKTLTETAEKRLQAMKDFAELGAGFKIAMRDLAIRGAGNILGSEQHGHIEGVGFHLYCKMLEDAVNSLRGEKTASLLPEPVIDVKTEAYIDGNFVADAAHKIEIYKRIADAHTDAEMDELTDELIDRFGEPTESVSGLLRVARIRNRARNIGIKSIIEKKDSLEITFFESAEFDPQGMIAIEKNFGRRVVMFPKLNMLKFSLPPKRNIIKFTENILAAFDGWAKKT